MSTRYLAFAWEPLDKLLADGMPDLVEEHWHEVGVHKQEMPLACVWDTYRTMENLGILRVLSARRAGELIGYNSFLYVPSMHYGTTACAANDAIFVTKDRRGGGAGIQLIDIAEQYFTELSRPRWCRVFYHDRHGIELLGAVLRRRGYVATDTIYSKMVRS